MFNVTIFKNFHPFYFALQITTVVTKKKMQITTETMPFFDDFHSFICQQTERVVNLY